MNKFQYLLLGLGVLIIIAWIFTNDSVKERVSQEVFSPNDTKTETINDITSDPEVVADDLTVPWEIAFLPDGDMLVSERGGNLKQIGKTNSDFPIAGVSSTGESGLLGLAIHPNYSTNKFIYLYFTIGNSTNNVVRYRLANNQLTVDKTIIEGIPGANNHNGGRIAFGPDKKLYITTGDAQTKSDAQNTNSLAGKILRINDDGSIPSDNPFNNAVYSYGHRNPQGLAWDNQDQLWATEHGRSGNSTGLDEINLIIKGANYGWPTIQGDETKEGMQTPKANSGPKTTWAPAGIVISGDTILFGGLRGQAIYQTTISGGSVTQVTSKWSGQYGRIRAVTIHDNYLYFSTSNRDGRGKPAAQDDRIIRYKL